MMEYYGHDFYPVFADTGHEHPVTVNYVRNLHVMSGGPRVEIVRADFSKQLLKRGVEPTDNPFLDMILWKGRAPSTKAQFCTEWVKLWPIKLWLHRNFKDQKIEMFIGIRRAESKGRALKEPFAINTYFDCMEVRPLVYESEKYMFDIMESHRVPPNPLYALGNKRVGCYPCIHANKTQLSLLPDWAWERLEYYQTVGPRSWFPPGVVPGFPPKHVPTISEVREWCRTSHGGRQFDMFKQEVAEDAPSCFSTWHECD